MQFHLRPLGIAQYTAVHPKLESQYRAWENPNSQQTLIQVTEERWQIPRTMNDSNNLGRASFGVVDDEIGETGERQTSESGRKKVPANRTDLRMLADSTCRSLDGISKR